MTKQLLNRFLELISLSTEIEKWTVTNFAKNPPRMYRLQAMDAIMKALKIRCSYQEFRYGEFLNEPSGLNKTEFLIKLKENFPTIFQITEISDTEPIDFQFIFEVIFSYRIQLQNLISVRHSVIEYSNSNSYPIVILDTINNKLQEDINGIDNLLIYLINPKGINFSIAELIEKYNYPVGELNEIDNDWI